MYRFIQRTVLAIAAVVAAAFIGVNARQAISVESAELPVEAKSFIKQHFGNTAIAKYEKKFWSNSYEIELTDGTDIDFDSKGKCTGIDAPDNAFLSQSIINDLLPKSAVKTLTDNDLINAVEEIEYNSSKGYKVEVRHHTIDDYRFDAAGKVLRVNHDN